MQAQANQASLDRQCLDVVDDNDDGDDDGHDDGGEIDHGIVMLMIIVARKSRQHLQIRLTACCSAHKHVEAANLDTFQL